MAFIDENKVQTVVSVGTGKTQELTPEGLFTITVKAKDPYYRRKGIYPGGDPKNPLGSRWIGFDAKEQMEEPMAFMERISLPQSENMSHKAASVHRTRSFPRFTH